MDGRTEPARASNAACSCHDGGKKGLHVSAVIKLADARIVIGRGWPQGDDGLLARRRGGRDGLGFERLKLSRRRLAVLHRRDARVGGRLAERGRGVRLTELDRTLVQPAARARGQLDRRRHVRHRLGRLALLTEQDRRFEQLDDLALGRRGVEHGEAAREGDVDESIALTEDDGRAQVELPE